jgi:exonuclease 3'-5' domain-containing protein 1
MSSNVNIVNTLPSLISLLDSLEGLPHDPPSLYFDLEGIKLGRLGSVSLLSLHVPPKNTTYVVDVFILKDITFSAVNENGTSLKSILESKETPKVFFDIRNDSDALYSHYKVCVNCIIDIQLLELATRSSSKRLLAGLAKCVENHAATSFATKQNWRALKESVSRLYVPEKGGRYEVFNERPLRQDIVQYSAQDVEMLPVLWEAYGPKLRTPANSFMRSMVREATQSRIKLSQSQNYNGHNRSMALGWDDLEIQRKRTAWGDKIISKRQTDETLDENDNWVIGSAAIKGQKFVTGITTLTGLV